MNCFAPSITHSPSSRRARVRVAPASEPASGSVSPKAASCAPGAQLGQPLGLLLVGAPEVDRHRAERRVGGHRDADRGVHPRQLLDRERVGERVGAAAAVLLGERDAHQPELRRASRRSRRGTPSSGRAPRRPARPPARANSRTVSRSRRCSSGQVEVHAGEMLAARPRVGRPARRAAAPRTRWARCRRRRGPRPRRSRRCRGAPRACRRRTPPGTTPRRSSTPCASPRRW